ncbi:SDR family oxidoreductase [Mycobacterium sp. EPa45]|uniref:SDR family oxidoreductase n=1 Tax=Mycobacterium sp. EPa45 TaxID=1545728 RepID=UPI00064237D9|nr:SDR family oxidoreductase [Mycobacterium sp. EPa45]AKK25463.1 oxidoreductase [Mycobacterium sp. EPa45]
MTKVGIEVEGMRTLVVGASSGIGRAIAIAAHNRGARVALAARRIDLLSSLAVELDGSAHEIDVSDSATIMSTVNAAVQTLGGLDAVIFTSAVAPFAYISDTDVNTWLHAFAVNAIGASELIRAARPHLSANAVILVASSYDVGRPPAGVGAYAASKAALNELLGSWRAENPGLGVIRASIGPTESTEILRGADRDLLDQLTASWVRSGAVPERMSGLFDVANTLLSLVATARANPSVISEVVHLAPRITTN